MSLSQASSNFQEEEKKEEVIILNAEVSSEIEPVVCKPG